MLRNIPGYRQHLERMLFGVPPDVPPRLHRYVMVSNCLFVFALVGHTAFVPVYWVLGAGLPLLVNTLFVPLDVLCLHLNHRRRHRTAFGLWTALVTLHTVLSTWVYGWDSGFHYYILSLTVFVFIAPWKKGLNGLLVATLMGIYLWLDTSGTGASTALALPAWQTTATRWANIGVNFAVLAYLAGYFAVAAEKIQKSMEESEKTLKTILAASPVGIALVKARQIFWANDTLARMLGYPDGRSVDRDLLRFYPQPANLEGFERLAHEDGRSAIDITDADLLRRDGTGFPGHIKIRPIVPGDRSRGSIVVVMDSTAQRAAAREREALLKKFQRAEKMEAVGTMAGGVAHDLNNLLSGFASYPDVLLMGMAPDHPLKKPLETIKQCGAKAAAIVQDLLTLTRRGVQVREGIDLNRAVAEFLGSPEHAHLRQAHPLARFETTLADEPPCILGSPVHLSKTVMNLATNACEAMAQGGSVRIATDRRRLETSHLGYEPVPPGLYAVLSVSDTGQGIARENLEHIFEPFYTRKVMGCSGTGLGLAVVWGTVKDSGGFIDVVSAMDQGTRFDLYFPAAPAPEQPPEAALAPGACRGAGEHVLVVDDMEEQRRVASGMLTALGYRVEALASGQAAVAWLRNHRTDLLLLDMIMKPGFDGLETYRRILAHRPGQKALIASGYSETERVSRALSLGPSRFLKKPYTLADLGRMAKELLSAGGLEP